MINFGFKLHTDRQIDFDANDRSFLKKITKEEPTFRLCIACGTCSATCSAGQFTNFSLRQIITNIKRGENSGIAESIRKCMFCGKCQLACPRGVNTRKIIFEIKKNYLP